MELKLPFLDINIKDTFISIDDIDKGIAELKNLDFVQLEYDDIRKEFFDRFKYLPVLHVPLDRKLLDHLALYRARPAFQINEHQLGEIKTFGAPPIDMDIGVQRANWRKRNVFYGADSPKTALLETKRFQKGEDFYIGKWRFDTTKLQAESYEFRVLFNDKLSQKNQWHIFTNSFPKLLDFYKNQFGEDYSIQLERLHGRLCELFLHKDENFYPLSAFLADYQLFNKYNSNTHVFFPFLIYPSVLDDHNSCNFAINPKFVETYMYLENVVHVKITDKAEIIEKLDIKKFGVVKDNHVDWYLPEFDLHNTRIIIKFIACTCGRIVWKEESKNMKLTENGSDIDVLKKVREIIKLNPDLIPSSANLSEQKFSEVFRVKYSHYLYNCVLEIDEIKHENILVNFQFDFGLTKHNS
ncbi:MAG: RES domain-containing protein [Bacteroidota bacterium]|nr:MAG: RES domain-containing protein [Bacteroidota bacterium]